MRDYVLEEATHTYFPGALPYRGRWAKRGYRTADEAHRRAVQVATHYAARHGHGGPDLRVIERGGKPDA
jgi:hypothetical protein